MHTNTKEDGMQTRHGGSHTHTRYIHVAQMQAGPRRLSQHLKSTETRHSSDYFVVNDSTFIKLTDYLMTPCFKEKSSGLKFLASGSVYVWMTTLVCIGEDEFNGGLYAYSHLRSLETQLEHNKGRYLAAKNADLYLNEAISRAVQETPPEVFSPRSLGRTNRVSVPAHKHTHTCTHTWVSTPAISKMEDCHDI